jgi:predicted permease
MEILIKTLEQVAILVIFIMVGYFFKKYNLITEDGKKVLASLLVNLFFPCYSISSLSSQLDINKIITYILYILAGFVLTICLIFLPYPAAKGLAKNKHENNILKYALTFGNIGYFGYPVVGAVFGAQARALMMLFCLPMTIGINTYGYQILTEKVDLNGNALIEDESKPKTFKERFRFLFSVPFIGTILGIVIGLLPFDLPVFLANDNNTGLLNIAGNCQSVTAMLLTGAVLANTPLKKLFTSFKSYLIGIIKLVVIPLIIGCIAYLLKYFNLIPSQMFMMIVIVSAMPIGMNVVVYPESVGLDSTEGSKMCFLSYILGLITVPLIFMLVQVLM